MGRFSSPLEETFSGRLLVFQLNWRGTRLCSPPIELERAAPLVAASGNSREPVKEDASWTMWKRGQQLSWKREMELLPRRSNSFGANPLHCN